MTAKEDHNRMAEPLTRGRPTLVQTAERAATPPPIPLPGKIPLFQCTRCGGSFPPKVCRTLQNGIRMMRCTKCAYAHAISPELLARLVPAQR